MKYTVLEGVYPPSDDSYLLMETIMPLASEGIVLELCCGTGIVGLSIASRAKRIVAVDLNPIAIKNTLLNYRSNGLLEKLDVVVGDLFSPLNRSLFDLVIMNPPYVDDDGKITDLSWSGGVKGRQIIDQFLDNVGFRLKPQGKAIFIQSDLNGVKETIERAKGNGIIVKVIGERFFQFETLLAIELTPVSW